jgi:hypothetical protein
MGRLSRSGSCVLRATPVLITGGRPRSTTPQPHPFASASRPLLLAGDVLRVFANDYSDRAKAMDFMIVTVTVPVSLVRSLPSSSPLGSLSLDRPKLCPMARAFAPAQRFRRVFGRVHSRGAFIELGAGLGPRAPRRTLLRQIWRVSPSAEWRRPEHRHRSLNRKRSLNISGWSLIIQDAQLRRLSVTWSLRSISSSSPTIQGSS